MKYLRSFIGVAVVLAEAALVCWWVFHVYGLVIGQASNSDSLTTIDFSRDLLRGVPLVGWNLPRSPFFFPDVLIASLVMLFGWSNSFTLIAIASINYSLFIVTCYVILKSAYGLKRISLPGIGLMATVALLAVAYVFPVSMVNVYWQLFASGTHFGTVVVVMLMLFFNETLFKDSRALLRVFFLFFITVASVVSNAMAVLFLMLWITSEMLSGAWKRPKAQIDMLVVFFSTMIGLGLSLMIPHQPLVNSFLKRKLLIQGFHSFSGWFFGSFDHAAFILLLVIASVAFPFLMRGRCKYFVLPSLGVIAVFPMFFQAVDSLRYLMLPAFILILCIVLAYLRLIGLVKKDRTRLAIQFLSVLLILSGAFFIYNRAKTEPAQESSAARIYQCIKRASLEYPLQDGIASYWNARPLKFYSNFEYYLAQVSPWSPKDGYFYWGNNWYDFIYKDTATKLPRKYNYIVASQDEIQSGVWGEVINKSKNKVTRGDYTLFYFDKDNVLWDFLFFHGPPLKLHKLNTDFSWAPACLSNSGSCTFTGAYDKLSTAAGLSAGGVIKANGKPGFLVYGPYIFLEPGKYRLVVKGKLSGPSRLLGTVDVTADTGNRVIAVKSIVARQSATEDMVSLDFEITKAVNNVEFRINIPAHISGFFKAYELTNN